MPTNVFAFREWLRNTSIKLAANPSDLPQARCAPMLWLPPWQPV
jgi:hypothetical protein